MNLVQKYGNFVQVNAQAVWDVARGQDGTVASWWAATPGGPRQTSVESNGSGVAAVCCALRADKLLESLRAASQEAPATTTLIAQETTSTAIEVPVPILNRGGDGPVAS